MSKKSTGPQEQQQKLYACVLTLRRLGNNHLILGKVPPVLHSRTEKISLKRRDCHSRSSALGIPNLASGNVEVLSCFHALYHCCSNLIKALSSPLSDLLPPFFLEDSWCPWYWYDCSITDLWKSFTVVLILEVKYVLKPEIVNACWKQLWSE